MTICYDYVTVSYKCTIPAFASMLTSSFLCGLNISYELWLKQTSLCPCCNFKVKRITGFNKMDLSPKTFIFQGLFNLFICHKTKYTTVICFMSSNILRGTGWQMYYSLIKTRGPGWYLQLHYPCWTKLLLLFMPSELP